ncbi:hypothetical protein H1C71_011112 [Ictidomys tridecemlineatus]|nr:hypothetical protein H1C71_011112 [Ictidomys tridecemlineatus]
MTQRLRILREALATASQWPHFARRLLSSQVPKPSPCGVPGTSGPSFEALQSLRFALLVGQTYLPAQQVFPDVPASCPSPPESHQLSISFNFGLLRFVGSQWESTQSPEGSAEPYAQDGDPEAISGGMSGHHVWWASSADVQRLGNITSRCL